jgi:hypothetical protein
MYIGKPCNNPVNREFVIVKQASKNPVKNKA